MRFLKKAAIVALVLVILLPAAGYWFYTTRESREPSFVAFQSQCAGCHGETLEGTDRGPTLMDVELKRGDTAQAIIAAIVAPGHTNEAIGGADELSELQIKGLALYISERRQKWLSTPASYELEPKDNQLVKSKHHRFRLERVARLTSRPYSIDILPTGEVLVAEKSRGLSLISEDGNQGDLIQGTPAVSDPLIRFEGRWLNLGSALDVELHPEFETNGWIYLSYTDRCQWSCGWPVPATMARVVRGRIKNGQWVDEELIWSVHQDHYTPVPDAVAAGRLAFDRRGHVFISIGGKNTYSKLHDLNTPFGKVHRVRDDGSIPRDNPFWIPVADRADASTIHTVWSYGHRTGQGLDAHPINGDIWNTEMGPRGGDEINRILRGKNYGWPLYTNGLDYNGEAVSIGADLGLDFPISETELPVVDFTPAPAISNFTFHTGSGFKAWKDDLLVGSLKAGTLYRIRLQNNELVEQEKLISNFGRIRDVEMGPNGFVYIALEHGETGSVWRLVPSG